MREKTFHNIGRSENYSPFEVNDLFPQMICIRGVQSFTAKATNAKKHVAST